jgi:Tol biopolymer transport system component
MWVLNVLLYIVIVLALTIGLISGCVERKEAPELGIAGEYFGQAPPGMEPELFAPDIVSTGLNERDAAFSPDGREFYYTVWLPMRSGVIMEMRQHEKRWSQPDVAPFSGSFSDLEPFVSPDGNVLLFVSNRPLQEGDPPKDYDIWFVNRTDSGWSRPYNFGSPINSPANEFFPSVTQDGTIYFTCDSGSSEDIYVSRLIDEAFSAPARLGEAVNSDRHEFNSVIAPDGSYLIFSSMQRDDGLGRGDMYISFRREDGGWTEARNMGETINSRFTDYCPGLSPDGKYLFFTSNRVSVEIDSTRLTTLDDMRRLHNRFQNGNGDIYWVSKEIIDKLRYKSED